MAEPATALTVANVGPSELARARTDEDGISVERIVARVKKIRQIRDEVMRPDVHFGKIPGVKKDSLLKPGAETLCMAFGLAPKFSFVEHRDGEHLECVVTCTLYGPNGNEAGDGIGSCSTRESKYAYRNGERTCPECGSTALLKSKKEPEFFCWAKKGGCGKTFKLDDKRITEQVVGRVANPDIADQYNTVRKMACKRAHVAATLFVTGASELFTQDVEDMPQHQRRAEHHTPDEPDETPPPTAAELEAALEALDAAATPAEITAAANAHKGKAWTDAQRKKLRAAMAEKTKALMGSYTHGDERLDREETPGREPGED